MRGVEFMEALVKYPGRPFVVWEYRGGIIQPIPKDIPICRGEMAELCEGAVIY
jgi:hypothetical protein